ncbi:MAG: RHS repeat-associated core domain-containing protein, partial [Acidobacteria bacterium]|nr:RHS repeat-associated core domain-containing protein [Acidobacteriota bacterium]
MLGRPTADTTSTIGSGVDTDVERIDRAYEVRGMVDLVTSYSDTSGSTVKNEVAMVYNDFAQLTSDEQAHAGIVGSAPKVQYGYVDGTGNTIRRTTVTYPNANVLTYSYSGTDANKLSRIEKLTFNSGGAVDVVDYTYFGLGGVAKTNYPQPGASSTMASGSSFSGFDRFGRVIELPWTKTTSGDLAQLKYGYDRASNRTYRENTVADGLGVHLDELYGYDNLQRLTAANRGQLSGSKDRITNHALAQTWNLDPTGNWKGFTNFDQATPANDLVQQRTTNAANEITDVTETVGNIWKTPAHDRNGNMTTMPQPDDPTSEYDCTYDAWNRLVKVETTVPATVAEYSYDGPNRRIRKYVPGGTDSYQHLYYNFAWQLLETRKTATAPVPATAQYQTVYSLRYLDAPVLRDDLAAAPDVRLYYTGDANFNVTSLFTDVDTPVERYVYDPYGQVTIYNATWSATQSPTLHNNSTL